MKHTEIRDMNKQWRKFRLQTNEEKAQESKIKSIVNSENEQNLIDEFGLVTPDLDFDPSGRSDPDSPNYDPTPIPELKKGQFGYKKCTYVGN